MAGLFETLKKDTLAAHKQLEKTAPFSHLMCDSLTLARYTQVLQVMAAFHHYVACTADRDSATPAASFMQMNQVEQALAKDLQALGVSSTGFVTTSDRAEEHAVSFSLAAGYVWLGSSMGARIINQWLSKHRPDFPRHYYSTMIELGENWRAFQQSVEAFAKQKSVKTDRVVHYANLLFEGLYHTASETGETACA